MTRLAFAVIVVMLSGSVPLAADWLVTAEGALVETMGPWQVEGGQIVFTLPNGTWASMRTTEVDLNASEVETVRANTPPPPPPPPAARPKLVPVLVLTDADIPQFSETGDTDSAQGSAATSAEPQAEPVKVISWREADGAREEGLELLGVLRNTGRELAADVSVSAEVKNDDGEVLMTATGFLKKRSLLPGKNTTFRVLLPDVFDFSGEPTFTVQSERVTVGSTNPAALVQGDDIDAGVSKPIADRKEQQGIKAEGGTEN